MDEINIIKEIRELIEFHPVNGDHSAEIRNFIHADFSVRRIKENSKRRIFQIRNESGRELFLKIFAPQRFPFSWIRFYAAKEYRLAGGLEKAGIPVVNYLGWGKKNDGGGYCISEGLADAVSARQYFFQTARFDSAKRHKFLEQLTHVMCILNKKHFRHPDFHTGNILFRRTEEKMYLVDPWGIRETLFWPTLRKIELASPCMELQNDLTDDEILEILLSSSLAGNKFEALELMDQCRRSDQKAADVRWPKIRKRILGGHPKYATIERKDGETYCWRHNLWFSAPEKLEINPAWRMEFYSDAQTAETIWLESFRNPRKEQPQLWIIHADRSAELYFPE